MSSNISTAIKVNIKKKSKWGSGFQCKCRIIIVVLGWCGDFIQATTKEKFEQEIRC